MSMNVFIVSYDLKSDDNPNYEGVSAALEKCGVVNHFQKSVCLVSSTMSAKEIRDLISPVLGERDTLFVAKIGLEWAGWRTRLAAWIESARTNG